MNSKIVPMGRAIADYWKTRTADWLRGFSPMFEDEGEHYDFLARITKQ